MTDLSHELYKYMVTHMNDVETERRRHSVWVMNREWYDECYEIGRPHLVPPLTMLGLPFIVREDGGVPHLELTD